MYFSVGPQSRKVQSKRGVSRKDPRECKLLVSVYATSIFHSAVTFLLGTLEEFLLRGIKKKISPCRVRVSNKKLDMYNV